MKPEPPGEIPRVVEHLFREEWGRMVAILTRIFGPDHLQLAEDVVQEALVRALRTWPYYGIPENPSAWIMRVSRNLGLDHARRAANFRQKEEAIALFLQRPDRVDEPIFSDEEIRDDRLRLMFVCCHPDVPRDAQVALALKSLCGFGTQEIARAFLSTEAAVAKRLTRAKQWIRERHIPFEIPSGPDFPSRLEAVLQTLYLLFNEGHKATSGERLTRDDLCHEAIRLVESLAAHPAGDLPVTHALAALMLLGAARLPARTGAEGQLLLLRDQDRSAWDRGFIARGMQHLTLSATGDSISPYHLQAGIAACHATAADHAATDWARILALYDQWTMIDPSPVVALNRAVAVANVKGPEAGLEALEAIPDRRQLEDYYLFHAVRGELEARRLQPGAAARHLRRALELTESQSELAFLSARIAQLLPRLKERGHPVRNDDSKFEKGDGQGCPCSLSAP